MLYSVWYLFPCDFCELLCRLIRLYLSPIKRGDGNIPRHSPRLNTNRTIMSIAEQPTASRLAARTPYRYIYLAVSVVIVLYRVVCREIPGKGLGLPVRALPNDPVIAGPDGIVSLTITVIIGCRWSIVGCPELRAAKVAGRTVEYVPGLIGGPEKGRIGLAVAIEIGLRS